MSVQKFCWFYVSLPGKIGKTTLGNYKGFLVEKIKEVMRDIIKQLTGRHFVFKILPMFSRRLDYASPGN